MRFRDRLAIFLVILVIGVNAAIFTLTYSFARHAMIESGKRELTIANEMFQRNLGSIAERVATGVAVMARDYGLRTAIAEKDQPTAISVLRNHGRRVNAERMMFIDLDGRVVADTEAPETSGAAFAFEGLVDRAWRDGTTTGLTSVEGRAYWTVVASVSVPERVGFVAAFVPIDNSSLDELRQLSAVPVSIALVSPRNIHDLSIIASSSDLFSEGMADHDFRFAFQRVSQVVTTQGNMLQLAARVATADNSIPVYVVYEYPIADVFESNWSLFGPLFMVLAGGVVVAIIGAIFIAGGVSAPLEKLARAADRIRDGRFDLDVEVSGGAAEINQLGATLVSTAQAVRDRENQLIETNARLKVARDEAREADFAKSQFIANMSHELRTPLNSIIGFADLIKQQALGPIEQDDYVQYAGFISEGGRGLLEFHNSILDIARLDSGKFDLNPSDYELDEILDAALRDLRPFAEEKGVGLDVSSNSEIAIHGDSGALIKALGHLVHNAIKFSSRGDDVRIEASICEQGLDLAVIDHGIGMARDDIARMLKPFQRGHSDYQSSFQGAGLGLSIANRIAELHGKSLSVVSAPMSGTRVTLHLDLAASNQMEAVG